MKMRRSVGPGTMVLLLVLTLGALGIGIALWSKVLTINGVVRTGVVNAEFVTAFTDDDDAVDNAAKDSQDTGDCAILVGPETPPAPFPDKRAEAGTSCDPSTTGRDPKPHYDKDVARCDAVVVPDGQDNEPQPGSQAARMRIENAYPSYHCTAWFDIHNNGTIPILLHAARVQGVEIAPCGFPGVPPTQFDLDGDGAPDIEICLSGVGKGTLWLGNDTVGHVFHTDTDGNVIEQVNSTPVTGVAWDGTNLWFSNSTGTLTRRTPDGQTVLDTFAVPLTGSPSEDMAWDSKRGRLWRIDHNPPTIHKIDPATGGIDASYPIPAADPEIGPRGGLGIAYDSARDILYASFCQAGCATLAKGLVLQIDPDDGSVLGEQFRTNGFATGGLAYEPMTDTLWVGDNTVVRKMSLSGAVLDSFARPVPGAFVDGLEFVPEKDEPQIDQDDTYQFDLDIHVLQTAPQGATFDFTADICLHQWNEEIGVCPAPGTPTPSPPPTPPPLLADFGDAPEDDEMLFLGSAGCTGVVTNYPSRLASSGPYHTDFTDVWLGPSPNTETAEPDAVLPNCDDWVAPPFDEDDGCLALFIGGPGSGWACIPGDGGGVFGPYPGTGDSSCVPSMWAFTVTLDPGAEAVSRVANVVVDDRCPGPDGFYGEVAAEHVLVNDPVTAAPGGSELKFTTGFFFAEVFCDDFITPVPPAPPLTDCLNGADDDSDGQTDEWGVFPMWTRFTVSRDPVPTPWDGTGPAGGFVYGETEDWLVFGDPGGRFQGQPPRPDGFPDSFKPDLSILGLRTRDISGQCEVDADILNQGGGNAVASVTRFDFGFGPQDAPTAAIPSGGNVTVTTTVASQCALLNGTIMADATDTNMESNEANNVASVVNP